MITLKDIIKESKWTDRKWGDPLPTLEDYMSEAEMKLQPKGGGKTVTFKDKDNYEKAKSSGKYEDPEGSGDGGEKEEPSGNIGADDYERDTDTTRGDPDDSWDDEEGRAKPTGKTDADTDDDEYAISGTDSDDPAGGKGDAWMHGKGAEEPKDEIDGKEYGEGFSKDNSHFFDELIGSTEDGNDELSDMLDAVKNNDWEKFKAGVQDISDDTTREHLQNFINHVDAGTYKSEFPSGKKGIKNAQKETMEMFRQGATYNESITIDGKQYKRISESVEPKVFDPHKEAKKQLGDLYTRMKGK